MRSATIFSLRSASAHAVQACAQSTHASMHAMRIDSVAKEADGPRDDQHADQEGCNGVYAVALAILIVGLAAAGVPLGAIVVSLAVLACPLMMIFMMGGMHGGHGDGHGGHDRPADPVASKDQGSPPAARDGSYRRGGRGHGGWLGGFRDDVD